ncbi:hypothetical protein [Paramicrobacterium agarici]|uniref:DUF3060 family protein n=1 Tax=Paramicrobacterium agarici TaxID=630514 RepID=A0A2A9DS88_9MICO|nr:hypothetical protein [Microbacterium agarici]PFG29251.1 hypothetical protein ATJ78_0151 [Microbacterium agarici]
MRRHVLAPALIALVALGLAGCAAADDEAGPRETPSVPQSLAPSATDVAVDEQNADEICEAESASGDADTCVLKNTEIEGSIVFDGTRVVKLINTTVTGEAKIIGAESVVVTDSDVAGDLEMLANTDAVVTTSTVGATLTVDGGKSGTVSANEVHGDLNCSGNGAVKGEGNAVSGSAANQCAALG